MREPPPDEQGPDTAAEGGAVAAEYAVVVAAAALLLTVPSLGMRWIYGPVAEPTWEPGQAVFLLGNMAAFALLVGYVVHVRGVGWDRLGLRVRQWLRALVEGLILGAVLTGVMVAWHYEEVQAEWAAEISEFEFMPIAAPLAVAVWAAALLANSVGEELLRAYLIRRGEDLGWHTALAAAFSVFVFFSYHTYYAADLLLSVVVVGGVMMALYYVLFRNLLGLIIGHTVVNYTWLALSA